MKISKLLQKTLIIQLVLFAVVAITISLVSSWNLRQNLLAEYISKGVVITKSIANYKEQFSLNPPYTHLQNLIEQFSHLEGVSYVFVHDAAQQIIAHTFTNKMLDEILTEDIKVEAFAEFDGTQAKIRTLHLVTLGNITDISYPILTSEIGGQIHVGMSHNTIEKRIRHAIFIQIVVMGLLFIITIAITYFFIERLSGDLNILIEGAKQVKIKQFDTVIQVKSRHEIGILADTFNAMVTEIRDYANHLQQSEERFRIITETINIPLVIVDECEGFILYANSPTATLFKTTMKQLLAYKLTDFFVDISEWERILERFVYQGVVSGYETQFKAFNHDILHITLSLQLIIVHNEQAILIAIQDIADRKRAESFGSMAKSLEETVAERTRELHDKNTRLTQLNQEKNELLGIVAHDLKNPLSAILGMSEDIEASFDEIDKEELIELAKKIQISSRQMFELITNLLDVNAIESGRINLELKVLDILPIIEFLVAHYIEIAKIKNITLHFYHAQEQYISLTDPNIVRQTLDNVISNAVKYSPKDKNIYIQIVEVENKISCKIQDEGPGLSFADQQKLFSKFTRLTPRPTGKEHSTGLGLFIVKKLVSAINGNVSCESKLGKGSTFTIEFPSVIAHK